MANLSDLIQQEAFFRAGGKPEGQRDIDKIQNIFSTIKNTGTMLSDIATQTLKDRASKLAIAQAERDQMPLQERFPGTFETPSSNGEIVTDANGNIVTDAGGNVVTKKAPNMAEGLDPRATLAENKEMAEIKKLLREKTALDQTPMLVNETWAAITGLAVGTPATYGELKQAASLKRTETMATGADKRQQKAQEFRKNLELVKEKMRIHAEERAVVRQEIKEIRPQINDLNKQIKLGTRLKNDLRYAIDNKMNVTGLFSIPLNRVDEVIGRMPKEQQGLLTRLRLGFADFVKERGGTAFTATEKQTFGPIMPEENVDEETNLNRITEVLDVFNDRYSLLEMNYPEAFKEVAAPRGAPKGSGGVETSTATFKTPTGNTFKVKVIP